MKQIRNFVLFMVICLPVVVAAQENASSEGIKWTVSLSWEQVKAKAKAENKFIFVDCFATWCGPCKAMDKNIYPTEQAGDAVNGRFISLRAQLDTSSKDGEAVKRWYKDAHYIATAYKIAVLPTFLFFSPAGELVHKGIGGKSSAEFIAMVRDALNPAKQFYSLIRMYRQGELDYKEMPGLALEAKSCGEPELSDEINRDYISGYLSRQDASEILTPKNIRYVAGNSKLIGVESAFFRLVGVKGRYIDSAMGEEGYARRLQYAIIFNEVVVPELNKAVSAKRIPDWGEMRSMLKRRYGGKIEALALAEARTRWFKYSQDWKNYAKYLMQQAHLLDPTDPREKSFFYLNRVAWDVFQYSDDEGELEGALALADRALPLTPPRLRDAIIDTKANLLYKMGRKSEAISFEERAVQLNSGFAPNLDKMRRGIPTWESSAGDSRVLNTGKKPIDSTVLGKWPFIDHPFIDDEGDYVAFNIANSETGRNDLVLKSTRGEWKKVVDLGNSDLYKNFFFWKNKEAVFKRGDSLSFVFLGKESSDNIPQVSSFKYPEDKAGDWIAYLKHNDLKELVLLNLSSKREVEFKGVRDYSFDGNGKFLVVGSAEGSGINGKGTLMLVRLSDLSRQIVWSAESKSSQAGGVSFDRDGSQLVFVVRDGKDPQHSAEVWYCKEGEGRARLCVGNRSDGIPPDCYITGSPKFSSNGQHILFDLHKEAERDGRDQLKTDVSVWSYKDSIVQPEQMRREGMIPSLLRMDYHSLVGVYNITGSKIIPLANEDESIQPVEIKGDYAVVMDNKNINDYWWSFNPQPSYYIISLIDGTRKVIKKNGGFGSLSNISFSPKNKYLIYWDKDSASYLVYNIRMGTVQNLTRSMPSRFDQEDIDGVDIRAASKIAGWDVSGNWVYFYDNYDLWKKDLSSDHEAINVTNGYGKNNKIKFRVIDNGSLFDNELVFSDAPGDEFILSAFSPVTKENGFYSIRNGSKNDPRRLTFGPYVYYRAISLMPPEYYPFNGFDMAPLKAANANCWILKRETIKDAPNFYFTRDFRSYKALSDLSPQSNYNWLTSELITCKQPDGTTLRGILYKPENFDPGKKYPVIFNYYEKMSYRLNEFPYPFETSDQLNIPWFVSNGYLVCTPDIDYSVASVSGVAAGESAYNSITTFAKYLSGLSYVDGGKMALQGHSFAGLETNYVVTHSTLFAAAAEAAGETDPISRYLTLTPYMSPVETSSLQSSREKAHEMYGCTPWERPELFRNSSAVLNADRVATPLLIMHNPKDGQVQWRQGVEFYMALRRLGKPVWMLQYNNSRHSLTGNDSKDYTVRLTQFFDHYLKGLPAPRWMTHGIPATLKETETGYALDPSGNCGKDCKVCRMWNEKMKSSE